MYARGALDEFKSSLGEILVLGCTCACVLGLVVLDLECEECSGRLASPRLVRLAMGSSSAVRIGTIPLAHVSTGGLVGSVSGIEESRVSTNSPRPVCWGGGGGFGGFKRTTLSNRKVRNFQ